MPDQRKKFRRKIRSLSIFNRIFLIIFPVMLVTLGIIELIMRWLELTEISYNFFLIFLIPVSFALIISYLTAKFTAQEISNPIKQFIESAKEIARGNFDHKVSVQSSDEIIQLSRIFNYMTLELKRIYQININEIIREKIKTEAILRNIADGVIVVSALDEILLLNDVIEDWFNVKEKDVHGCSLTFFFPELKFLTAKTKESAANDIFKEEIEIHPENNPSKIILAAHASKVMDNFELIAIVIVLRNITKEKEVDKLKTELVHVVAHELRSPLTSIAGFSEILKDPELPPVTKKEYIDIIRYESGRLAELINKFLDISRIESGQTSLTKIPVDIVTVISNVLAVNSHLAIMKHIHVVTDFVDSPPLVLVDPDLIGQVALNLFSNAVKYSPESSVITISINNIKNSVVVQVRDTGYGISKENQSRLFQKFFRAKDDKNVKDVEGTGLGLAFVKEIIQQHDGRLNVESDLGKGSLFSFSLPHYIPEKPIESSETVPLKIKSSHFETG
ncbi:cell wall metabolism sensor histidine kinase WalK [bacterium]|nr:MAG: cell wall metabolism sensor histidine kinase WalK [bacterium]